VLAYIQHPSSPPQAAGRLFSEDICPSVENSFTEDAALLDHTKEERERE